MSRRALLLVLALAVPCLAAPTREELLAGLSAAAERDWAGATRQPTPPGLGARGLFSQALVLCELGRNLERLDTLFDLAGQMQDKDPASRGYGNFRWYWRDPSVMDFNAVDFSMQTSILLWQRHRDKLPATALAKFTALVDLGLTGCFKHKVSPSYTNISLMNAGNLIVLGELRGRTKELEEGYRRLDRIVFEIAEHGIHEYDSPTYYGVDLYDLALIAGFAQRERGRQQARALLDLFTRDIAANWFEPAQRLAGTQSRTYDYLHGLGELDVPLWAVGWLTDGPHNASAALFSLLTPWRPDLALKQAPLPRLVRQKWGGEPTETKTHYVLPDVTLGTSASCYHNMDMPLTVDLPGPRTSVRGYFIADGRHDPYGKVVIPEGKGPHSKTLHLRPFWAAAQTRRDALGLVMYRAGDLPTAFTSLESHFVFPRAVDGVWLGDQPVKLGAPFSLPVPAGATVVYRQGSAAVGLKVPVQRNLAGAPGSVSLVDDGNKFGALRLTVDHMVQRGPGAPYLAPAAACFWVRVGSGLDDVAFAAWRREFAAASGTFEWQADGALLRAAGVDGPLAIAVGRGGRPVALTPAPTTAILELDGQDVGGPLLAGVEPVKSLRGSVTAAAPWVVDPARGSYREAEDGQVFPTFEVGRDPLASGGHYVWEAGEPGGQGGGSGQVSYTLHLDAPATLYLWGRVQSPTPDDDSFFGQLSHDGQPLVPRLTWALGTHTEWAWVPFGPDGAREPLALRLPAGDTRLDFACREDGTKLDRLYLTSSAQDRPR